MAVIFLHLTFSWWIMMSTCCNKHSVLIFGINEHVLFPPMCPAADPVLIWRCWGSSQRCHGSYGALQPVCVNVAPESADAHTAWERRHGEAIPGCSHSHKSQGTQFTRTHAHALTVISHNLVKITSYLIRFFAYVYTVKHIHIGYALIMLQNNPWRIHTCTRTRTHTHTHRTVKWAIFLAQFVSIQTLKQPSANINPEIPYLYI